MKGASTRCSVPVPCAASSRTRWKTSCPRSCSEGVWGAGDVAFVDVEEGQIKVTALAPTDADADADADAVLEEEPAPAD